MALIQAGLILVAVCAFLLSAASLGNLILRILHLEMDTDAQHLVICAGVGVNSIEMLLFGVAVTQQIRKGCFVIAGLLCALILAEFKSLAPRCARSLKAVFSGHRVDHLLLLIIGITLGVEFLTSLAPLTGSDALHYHFTTQKLILEYGFHPDFSISHSFLCGQHHLLILFGLALGSEKLAMGLIFLGGILTVFSLVCLASRWSSPRTASAITLLFLLTPVVFWQISSSGAPDIWMAFFTSAAVIVLCQNKISGTWRQALLAGLFAGGVVGAKYTGCLVAVALATAIAIEYRSTQSTLLLGAGSLLTGIWPYMRNLVWTGDPVFPFLSTMLIPGRVNLFALNALRADTGAFHSSHWVQFVPFVFFAGMRQGSLGFWDFFGPIVFALAPLWLASVGNFHKWKVPAVVWCVSAVAVFYASGLPRFLLPIFPLALAFTAAGLEFSQQKGWKIANRFAWGLVLLLWGFGGAGLAMYSRKPVVAALGIVREVDYLKERRPEYQEAEVINRVLASQTKDAKTLLFIRHLYSLNAPFLNGDPATSWMINPDRLRTPQDWAILFQKEGITFVARSPDYPEAIEAPLMEMEAKGDLIPLAQCVVRDFQGMRIEGKRAEIPVVVLRVKSATETQGDH
jgi:Dolichyl-phosphate-mannose-protein mannosyltransferase